MPFTFAHPAAAIPFTHWGLVLSALVIGSMAPDLMYFFCLSTRCQFGHTLTGLIIFCIPVGLVALWVFHTGLKYPLLSLFPISHQKRLLPIANQFRFFPWQRLLLIVLSLFIGALTHVIWDSFTHSDRWGVQQLPILNTTVIETTYGSIKGYKILQYISTLAGATLLLYFYWRWLKQATKESIQPSTQFTFKTKLLIILVMGLSTGFLATIYGFLRVFPVINWFSFYYFLQYAVIAGVSVWVIELMIFSMFWHFFKIDRPERNSSSC
jgi:hypothetical protein